MSEAARRIVATGPGAGIESEGAGAGIDTEGPEIGGGIVRAGLVVTSLYLVSRLLGWVRLSVLAAVFGASSDLDAFYAAFRIPDLMFQLVAAGALSSALIPMITALVSTGERDRAWRVTSTVTNVMLVGLLVLGIAFELLAPLIVPLITPGYTAVEQSRIVDLTRIMLASPILLALGTVATSALNANGRFGAAALAPVVYNLGIIGGAVLLAAPFGVTGLAVGVVVGSIAHFLVQLRPLLDTGFRYRAAIDVADDRARQTLLLLAPRAFGLGVTQVVFVVVTSVASTLGAGAITVLNFAFTLMQIPIGVLGVPLGAVVFPSLARTHATGSDDEYVALLDRATRVLLFVMIPITGLGIVLRTQVVTVLFEWGKFDPGQVGIIATTLAFFLLGLGAHASLTVLARAFYARQDTRTPVAAAVLTVVVNSTLAVILAGPYQLAGLALSFTIAAWLEALVLLAILRRRLPELDVGSMARLLIDSVAATAIAAVVAIAALSWVEGLAGGALGGTGKIAAIEQGIVATAAFGIVFLASALVLRIRELPLVTGSMLRALRGRAT